MVCVANSLENIQQWKKFEYLPTFVRVMNDCIVGGTVSTALHGNSICPSVRPSVRPSVKRMDCDKTEEKSVKIFIPYERPFLVFWEKEWLVESDPFYLKFGSTGPRWSEIADFEPIIARSASAVTPSEKSSINTNRKSTTRFPMSLRWSLYDAPKSPKGPQKRKSAVFPLKSHFSWRTSAKTFLCVKTISGSVIGHSMA